MVLAEYSGLISDHVPQFTFCGSLAVFMSNHAGQFPPGGQREGIVWAEYAQPNRKDALQHFLRFSVVPAIGHYVCQPGPCRQGAQVLLAQNFDLDCEGFPQFFLGLRVASLLGDCQAEVGTCLHGVPVVGPEHRLHHGDDHPKFFLRLRVASLLHDLEPGGDHVWIGRP